MQSSHLTFGFGSSLNCCARLPSRRYSESRSVPRGPARFVNPGAQFPMSLRGIPLPAPRLKYASSGCVRAYRIPNFPVNSSSEMPSSQEQATAPRFGPIATRYFPGGVGESGPRCEQGLR